MPEHEPQSTAAPVEVTATTMTPEELAEWTHILKTDVDLRGPRPWFVILDPK